MYMYKKVKLINLYIEIYLNYKDLKEKIMNKLRAKKMW